MSRLFILAGGLTLLAASGAVAESTRTIKLELKPPVGRIAVENLAGVATISQAAGDSVEIVATVHAESDRLAEGVRLEESDEAGEGKESAAKLVHVRYPVDEIDRYRYPTDPKGSSGFWSSMFESSGSTVEYGGRKVRVRRKKGTLLYVDLEVRLPKNVDGHIRECVGAAKAESVTAKLTLETASAAVSLRKVSGDVSVNTVSGDLAAVDLEGSANLYSVSGDVDVDGIRGTNLTCHTASGDLQVRRAAVQSVRATTASGDIEVADDTIETFEAHTASGDVKLRTSGRHLSAANVRCASGDVTLKLDPESSFHASVTTASGKVANGFDKSGSASSRGETVFDRGDGHARIDVTTASGDVGIEPIEGG